MSAKATTVEIEGKELKLTNLDKVLYPKAHFTKAHVIDYYRRISPALLPHLKERALTLKRYPDGVEGPFFYEKECPPFRPEWVKTAKVWSEGKGKNINFCVVDTLPALVWAANLADLEMHTYLAKVRDVHRPTVMVFDLDPGPGADLGDCCDVALWLRDLLDELSLASLAKTSGSKGMQLYVPLHTPTSFDQTKPLSRALGEMIEREHPDRVTTNMSKAARPDRVFVDWSQNDDHKTTVCVYSLRANEQPTVSTPLRWSEVEKRDLDALRFLPEEVLARFEKHGDLFGPVLTMEQVVPVLM